MGDNVTKANKEKEKGNYYFGKEMFVEAITCYTRAIILNPTSSVYFTNRALCNLKLKKWESTCEDCYKALEINKENIKGYCFLGSALTEMGRFNEAVRNLEKALDIAKKEKMPCSGDIAYQIRATRGKRFRAQEDIQIANEKITFEYTMNAMKSNYESDVQAIKDEFSGDMDESAMERIKKLEEEYIMHSERLKKKFDGIAEKRAKREVPDYLCGRITLEIFRDPVITPCGLTYERKILEQHLQKNGPRDPISRRSLTKEQLIPNLALKEVIEDYLDENEWAIDF